MSTTGALVHIPRTGTPDSSERVITIKGTHEQIEEVKRQIALLTSTSTAGGRAGIAEKAAKEQQQQAVAAISMYLPQYGNIFYILSFNSGDAKKSTRKY